mgnify:CR=1 FL=1
MRQCYFVYKGSFINLLRDIANYTYLSNLRGSRQTKNIDTLSGARGDQRAIVLRDLNQWKYIEIPKDTL